MIRGKAVSFFCLLIATLLVVSMNVLPAFGVPGKGTSITVNNEVTGAATDSVWSYTVTEVNPPKNSDPFYASFDLEAGGTYSFGGLRRGDYRVVEVLESGFATIIITSNKYEGSEVVYGCETVINLEPSEGKTVTFTNIAFAYGGVVLPPPGFDYSIPPLQPVPVQASFDVDITGDGVWDLVLGKPTVVFVNMTGAEGEPFASGDSIQVSVEFEAQIYTVTVYGGDLATSDIIAFYSADYPITPSSAGDETITGSYQVNGGSPVSLTPTDVTVKETVGLSLYYAPLSKSKSYGIPGSSAFDDMMQYSADFVETTYPVQSVTATGDYGQAIAGSRSGSGRDPYSGMLKDCQAVAQQAQLLMGGSAIGVAVAPGDLNSGYFDYHGFPGAVGVSFGPTVKGVIALEGYYTVPAHEIAHTFGLYYGYSEEYYINPTVAGNGVNIGTGALRTGYNFMSVAYPGTVGESDTWINTDTTYEYLFTKTVVIPDDPEVLLVNGIIYEDGTVEFPLDWIHIQEGTPDTISSGNYALRYVDIDGNPIVDENGNPILGPSFDASFSMQPSYPDENGDLEPGPSIEYDQAGFSFAIPYPPIGTQYVQIIDINNPIPPLATYDMDDVKSFGCYVALDGDEGSNGWFFGDVDVTISAIADPTAITPDYAVKEIHYILDEETETTVPGSSATFTITGEDAHTLVYWAVDTDDIEGVHRTQTVGIDNTAPVVTISSPAAGSYTSLNLPELLHSATDNLDPNPSLYSVDGWSTEEGTHTVTVTYVDAAGNFGSATVTYTVRAPYVFGGFLSPIPDSQYKVGRTVPVKFQLTDSQGYFVTDAEARIYWGPVVNGGVPVYYDGHEKGGDTNLIEYNFAGNMYQFNLDTTGQLTGLWRIWVEFDDGSSTLPVEIILK